MRRGYFGIGIQGGKFESNIGTLWRHAYIFGADFIFTIGKRYTHEVTDTTKAQKNIPLYHYRDWRDFEAHLPSQCEIVFVEQFPGLTTSLTALEHPIRAAYVLGAEDKGIDAEWLADYTGRHPSHEAKIVEIPSSNPISMNVATAGTINMHDRYVKGLK